MFIRISFLEPVISTAHGSEEQAGAEFPSDVGFGRLASRP